MRLTLRTLLAYLDRILDDADAQELERKIQESELATQLVHRIRSVTSQRRLGALDVRAGGLGRDANSVAEYLDNTLPAEQIPDFERVCLESDVHLSEVAACHHILTLVLGEPASIPEGLKEKIYQWSGRRHDRSEPAPQGSGAPAAPVDSRPISPPTAEKAPEGVDDPTSVDEVAINQLLTSDSAGTRRRVDAAGARSPSPATEGGQSWDEDEHWTEAPDYLKRPRAARWKPIAVGAAIAFLLVLAALRGMGPLDRTHPLAQRLGLEPPQSTSSDKPAAIDESIAAQPDDSSAASLASPAPPPAAPSTTTSTRSDDPFESLDETAPPTDAPSPAPRPAADEEDDLPSVPPGSVEPESDEESSEVPDPVLADDDFPPMDDRPEPDPRGALPAADRVADESALDPLADPAAESAQEDELTGPLSRPDRPDPLVDDSGTAPDFDLAGSDADGTSESPATDAADRDVPDAADLATNDDRSFNVPIEGPALIDPLATGRRDPGSPPAVPPEPAPRTVPNVASTGTPSAPEGAAAPPSPAPRVPDVGRFLDAQQVLVKLGQEPSDWQRVPAGTQLQVGDLLMSLPAYRAPLMLASGMQVTLIGGTRLGVLALDSEATPWLRLEFGRLKVESFTSEGTRLGLRWAENHSGLLRLDDVATLAIELWPVHAPGTDPQSAPPHQVLHIFVTSGSVEWNADQGPPITVTAGQRLTVIDEHPPLLTDVDQQPTWIDGQDTRPIDLLAARNLAQQLTPDRPVVLVLKEEAENRRREIRSLAVSALAFLGHFDPLFVALNDPELRAYWSMPVDVLLRVPHLSSEFAEGVKRAMVQRHGEGDGMALYRLLWGFTPEQLAEGSAADLVDYLDHESVDYRVLASEQLKSITGQTFLYSPAQTAASRRRPIARWRRELEDGKISYKQPPEIIGLLENLAAQAEP